MKKYIVKPEYIDDFYGILSIEEVNECQTEGIDSEEIERLSRGWGTPVEEIMEMLEEL